LCDGSQVQSLVSDTAHVLFFGGDVWIIVQEIGQLIRGRGLRFAAATTATEERKTENEK
jgi:hypothetical protein